MQEPLILGIPLTTLFLYFIVYAFLGWCVESAYCSIRERRWVPRGFLYGPVCPIYGVGVLLMILFFAPLSHNVPLFFVTATVVMSAWEYLVGWLLETLTHIKYWDYSDRRFHLHGRICLQISLCWGLLSYITIFGIHPQVAALLSRVPPWLRHCLSSSAATLLAVDAVTTIRQLALTAQFMAKLEAAGQELRLQSALAKAEMADRLETMGDRLEEALRDSERLAPLRTRYDALLDAAEAQSRRFRHRYAHMSSPQFPQRLTEVGRRGAELREKLKAVREKGKRKP